MKVLGVFLALAALVAAFAVGRSTSTPGSASAPTSVASLASALEELDPLTRRYQVSAFMQSLTPENLPEALDPIEARLRYVAEEELELFMYAWARFDPEAALTRALGWPNYRQKVGSTAAMSAWAYYDPENALVGLNLVEDARLRTQLKDVLLESWIKSPHKQSASDFIGAMNAGLGRQKFVSQLSIEYIRLGHDELKNWAESIEDDGKKKFKATVFEKASHTLATVDPIEAASWVEGHLEHDYSAGAPALVARRWSDNDVLSAFEWIVGLPSYERRDSGVAQIFGGFLNQRKKRAQTWIRENAPAAGLDPAVQVLVKKNVKIEPAVAFEWTEFIHDPQQQHETRVRVGRYWLRNDSKAAKEWLTASGVPDETREAILEKRSAVSGAPAPPGRGSGAKANSAEGKGKGKGAMGRRPGRGGMKRPEAVPGNPTP